VVPGSVVVVVVVGGGLGHETQLEDTNALAEATFDHSSGHPGAAPVRDPEMFFLVEIVIAALVVVELSRGESPVPLSQKAVSCLEEAVDQSIVH
jgi:predicted lipid carrier protein YhbT